MKKFLALVALVAMVAVASVAYADEEGAVTVNGTIGETVDMCTDGDLTVAIGAIPTAGVSAEANDTCDYDVNSVLGYSITFENASPTLDNAITADTIATLTENGVIDDPTAVCVLGNECWSYRIDSTDPGAAFGLDTDILSAPGNGGCGAGDDEWCPFDTLTHGIPAGTDTVITDGTVGTQSYTFTMLAQASATPTTDSGDYSNATGLLTLAVL